jgi:ribosomal protein S3AE
MQEQKKQKKAEKKKFLPVDVPVINKTIELYGTNIESLNNRTIKLDLSRNLKGKSLELVLKVSASPEKAVASPLRIQLLGFFIRRMIRKGTDYVEDSFNVECRDAFLRIKPFLITRKKVSRKTRKGLRDKAKEELLEYIKDMEKDELVKDIISNNLQKTLSLKLKKIYPLALCEIRHLEIKDKKPGEILEKQVAKKVEKESNEPEQKNEEEKEKSEEKKEETIENKEKKEEKQVEVAETTEKPKRGRKKKEKTK